MTDNVRYNPILHRTAQLTVAATLLLIFMGGLVTSHGAGLAVPDWPNSYGYNMFTFPPSQWIGGVFYEHTHRLMGTVVGFCAVLLVLFSWAPGSTAGRRKLLWTASAMLTALAVVFAVVAAFTPTSTEARLMLHHVLTQTYVGLAGVALVCACAALAQRRESRRWVRWLCVGLLAAVLFQGVLGGLRVVFVNLDLAVVHACVAQAFFCLAGLVVVVTSPWWFSAPDLRRVAIGRRIITLAATCVVVIYLQLVVGALMRHYQAGLAIPDLPLAYGQLLPPTDQASLEAANESRLKDESLRGKADMRVTLGQVWLHFGHRVGAVLVTISIVGLLVLVFRHRHGLGLTWIAATLAALLVAQLTLGVLTVMMRKPADIASLHVAVGALTLLTVFVLLVRSMRVFSPRWRTASRGFDVNPHHPSLVPA